MYILSNVFYTSIPLSIMNVFNQNQEKNINIQKYSMHRCLLQLYRNEWFYCKIENPNLFYQLTIHSTQLKLIVQSWKLIAQSWKLIVQSWKLIVQSWKLVRLLNQVMRKGQPQQALVLSHILLIFWSKATSKSSSLDFCVLKFLILEDKTILKNLAMLGQNKWID